MDKPVPKFKFLDGKTDSSRPQHIIEAQIGRRDNSFFAAVWMHSPMIWSLNASHLKNISEVATDLKRNVRFNVRHCEIGDGNLFETLRPEKKFFSVNM